jgi:hypothetical protein
LWPGHCCDSAAALALASLEKPLAPEDPALGKELENLADV